MNDAYHSPTIAAGLSPLGQAAIERGRAGFAVFPCWPRGKTPLTTNGHLDATRDEASICALWRRWPNANIGVATGAPSGLIVVDVDGDEGERLLARLEEQFAMLPPTAESTTGKGRHLWFELPEGCGKAPCSKGGGLDIRADGGYTIAPPSVHPNGKRYEWDPESAEAFALAPQWLLEFARNRKAVLKALDGPTAAEGASGGLTGEGRPEPHQGKANGNRAAFPNPPTPEPWTETGEAQLRSVLTKIPADDRDIWRNVGFALHDLTAADSRWPGRALWDDWSKSCREKFDPAGQDKAWVSFSRGYEGPRVTIATIYHLAKENGWIDPLGPLGTVRNETARKCADATQARPMIRVAGGDLAREADEAEQALVGAGLPIFVRAGALVSPVCEEAPAAKDRKTTIARLRKLTVDGIIDRLSRYADFQRYDARAKKLLSIDPPERVAKIILSREGAGKFPQIAGVITTPTLRPDGSILTEPGYDPPTRLYLALDARLEMPAIPAAPTSADALEALSLLRDLLSGFPFVTRVDRAVALSGIMTAVLRGALSVAPMHGFRAHTAGTGKSLLVDVAATIATGRLCPVIAAGKTEEETEKRLGALLHDGVSIVSIDNVSGELGGDALAQMTERALVRVRILGKSEAPEFECKAAIFATGNNLVLVGDMVRRAVVCTLDAGVERPELREFKFDPIDRVLQNRGAYVAACLTIALAYKAAGAPKACPPLGSYGEWSDMVRAPLIWLGEADPVDSMETAREEDPELAAIRELFAQLPGHFPEHEAWTAGDLVRVACLGQTRAEGFVFTFPDLRDLLLRVAAEGGKISPKRLGKWLSKISGRVVGGLRLEKKIDRSHGNRFSLRPAPQGRAHTDGGLGAFGGQFH